MEYQIDYDYTNFGLSTASEEVFIEFYDTGAGSPLIGPGNYQIGATADDRNYGTCATCALVFTQDDKVFFATSGVIKVTELDQGALKVKATLENATFVEVTIDQTTYTSTPVANGDTWCFSSVAIDFAPECTKDEDCGGDKPFCDTEAFACVGCRSSLDCTAEKPVCSQSETGVECIAGITVCTGDDANEDHDDGPKGANALTLGTPVNAKICGEDGEPSANELDFYTFTLAAPTNVEIVLSWPGTEDLDIFLVDANLESVKTGGATLVNPEKIRAVQLAAGTYYIAVSSYEGAPTAAVAYTLTASVFTPECTDSNTQCTTAERPVCDTENFACVQCLSSLDCNATNPVCKAGNDGAPVCGVVDVCTGDDVRENGDDGPKGATTIAVTDSVSGKICGAVETPSEGEADFFTFTSAGSENFKITLDWADTAVDLDLYILDSAGEEVDSSFENQPEVVTLNNLAAGSYYILVQSYDGAPTAATSYTLSVARP
ncbi:MAG: PPC domain-containing protein [Deltaproteobacteria bacterium]|nr:PPC domain-containing protein [Deltaproteobacteria bacterium]